MKIEVGANMGAHFVANGYIKWQNGYNLLIDMKESWGLKIGKGFQIQSAKEYVSRYEAQPLDVGLVALNFLFLFLPESGASG